MTTAKRGGPEGKLPVPPEYRGREQSYLKHRVLEEYLLLWGLKLGSIGRRRGRTRLWYVDTFAGPWNARADDLADTSIAISLDALEKAAATWRARGHSVEVSAIFVERNPRSFAQLEGYLAQRTNGVRATALQGEFGEHVGKIARHLASDAAFIFVDPTGWKGAAMKYIAPLVKGTAPRDVLVNVMFDHLNRQKDRLVEDIRQQIRDFFGLEDQELPAGLDEDQLMAFYREQLKRKCRLRHAADLAVPHPTMERTKFRLVVGGMNAAVLEVFRDVESKIMGREAAGVRDDARRRQEEERTSQLALLSAPPPVDSHYGHQHAIDEEAAAEDVLRRVAAGPIAFGDLWPSVLEARHITLADLRHLVWALHERRLLLIRNATARQRTTRDDHVLTSLQG